MTGRGDHRPAPTFEGRTLLRPEDEVVDQGLTFDLATLLDRRQALRLLGVGVAGLGLAACGGGSGGASSASSSSSSSSSNTASGQIPQETAGPYPGDGSNGPDVLEQSGIVRSDLRSSFGGSSGTAAGVPMTLGLTITSVGRSGAALSGAAVYVWHCDRAGRYSLYSDGVTDQNYLRGVQVADAQGRVTFTSVFPACYSGRWPHIHFEVYPDEGSITDASKAIATSQVALPESACHEVYAQAGYEESVANLSQVSLTSDMVFGDDGGARQLGTVTGDATKGYAVSLAVAVA